MNPPKAKLLYTVNEAAALLSMSRRSLERLVARREFPAFHKAAGSKVEAADIDNYIEQLRRQRMDDR